MNHIPKLPVRKYEVKITKINTGESQTHRFYALGSGSAKTIIERMFDEDKYTVNSVNEIVSVVKIMVDAPCPN